MPISYHFDEAHRVVRAYWQESVSAEEVLRYWTQRTTEWGNPDYRRTLADIRSCKARFNGPELERLVGSTLGSALPTPGCRTAVLVETPAEYGTARQFQVFFHGIGESRIFTDEADALAWLSSP